MNKNVSRRSFVTGATGVGAFAALAGLAGCNQKKDDGGQKASGEKKKKLTMVTDTGGVNDQSFNQSAWEGMTELKDKNGWDVSYLESKQDSDYATNLDKAVDAESDLVWGVGFAMADATLKAAKDNPNTQFAIIDNGNDSQVSNFTGVMFRAQEPSFVVGYIAARTTKTGKVGFVGGISSALIDQFEYGYRGGVAYANKEKGTNVEISAQYAESFSDAAKGDIVFHAAGGVGTGVIEAAKDANKLAIGVDRDQAYLAPENVLTSALKRVNVAIVEISEKILKDGQKGGTTISLGASEDAVGISEEHHLMGEDTYKAATDLLDKIKAGSVVPPTNKDELDKYVKSLS